MGAPQRLASSDISAASRRSKGFGRDAGSLAWVAKAVSIAEASFRALMKKASTPSCAPKSPVSSMSTRQALHLPRGQSEGAPPGRVRTTVKSVCPGGMVTSSTLSNSAGPSDCSDNPAAKRGCRTRTRSLPSTRGMSSMVTRRSARSPVGGICTSCETSTLSQRRFEDPRGAGVQLRTDCVGADAHPLSAKRSSNRTDTATTTRGARRRRRHDAVHGWIPGSTARRRSVRPQETRARPSSAVEPGTRVAITTRDADAGPGEGAGALDAGAARAGTCTLMRQLRGSSDSILREQLRGLESALQLGGEQRYDCRRSGRKLFGAGRSVFREAAGGEPRLDGAGGELGALPRSLAAVAGTLDRGEDGEGVGVRVQRRDAFHVEGDLGLLVAGADEIVEDRRLGGGELLIEEPGLAGVDSAPEVGPLGFRPEAGERDDEFGIELPDGPQRAFGRDERDGQTRERVEGLSAALGPGPARGSEDEDGARAVAEAYRHRLERARAKLEEHVLPERLREEQMADEEQRLRPLRQPRGQHLALRSLQALEVDETEPRAAAVIERGPSADARAGSRRAGGRMGPRGHGEHPRPGRRYLERNHRHLAQGLGPRDSSKKTSLRSRSATNRITAPPRGCRGVARIPSCARTSLRFLPSPGFPRRSPGRLRPPAGAPDRRAGLSRCGGRSPRCGRRDARRARSPPKGPCGAG